MSEYSIDNNLSSANMRSGHKNNEFIGSLASVLGGVISRNNSMTEEEKDLQKLKEGRARGMSGVDDNSLMQMQSNTYNMIEHHFQKNKLNLSKQASTTQNASSPTTAHSLEQ